MDLRVMALTHLHGAAVGIVGVDVMMVDQAAARPCCATQEEVNAAVVARQVPPRLGVVDLCVFHGRRPSVPLTVTV